MTNTLDFSGPAFRNLSFQQRYIAASLEDYKPGENLIIGPNSAEFQLAALGCGAVGDSFNEIVLALGGMDPKSCLEPKPAGEIGWRAYINNLSKRRMSLNAKGNKPETMVRSSSGFFSTERIIPSFEYMVPILGGEAKTVANPAVMTNEVNKWAATATATPSTPGGLINPLLKRALDSKCVFVALTADAFELKFRSPFNVRETQPDDFTDANGMRHIADFMTKKFKAGEGANYIRKHNGTVHVILPYGQDGDFSLRLTPLPTDIVQQPTGLRDWYLEQTTSNIMTGKGSVRLTMPRADLTGERDTMPVRNRLGIYTIYDSVKADLSGLVQADPDYNAYVGASIESAKLKINEVKTEGAVVQVDMVMRSVSIDTPPVVRLDKPYMIEVVAGNGLPEIRKDNSPHRSETVLMLAIVNKPGRLPAPAV